MRIGRRRWRGEGNGCVRHVTSVGVLLSWMEDEERASAVECLRLIYLNKRRPDRGVNCIDWNPPWAGLPLPHFYNALTQRGAPISLYIDLFLIYYNYFYCHLSGHHLCRWCRCRAFDMRQCQCCAGMRLLCVKVSQCDVLLTESGAGHTDHILRVR